MRLFWESIQCGTATFKYLPALQEGIGDCAPTSIAMLVWNLGYGLGSEALAIRAGVYAQQHANNPDKIKRSKQQNLPIVGVWGTLLSGMSKSEELYMLDSYGLKLEIYFDDRADLGSALANRGTAVPAKQLVEVVNSLEDGEGALVCGVTESGERHAIPIIRRGHVVVALDRIRNNVGWVNCGSGQRIARLDEDGTKNGAIEIKGMPPHGNYRKAKKQAKSTSLETADVVFVIKKQSLLSTWGGIVTHAVSNLSHYFY